MARWAIGRAATSGAMMHLAIDASSITSSAERGLNKLLTYVCHLREEHLIQTQTLGHIAERFKQRRVRRPMRSVLRAA